MNELSFEYLAAKRALFDHAYAFLNERQRQAVFTVNGPLLVLAGAGSGKTTVLVRRIAFLIRYGNAYYSEYVPPNLTREDVERLRVENFSSAEDLNRALLQFSEMPCDPYRVLAITFTNKAAGEIKSRLSGLFPENPEAAGDIWSGTFHSVCVRIMRRHGELLGYRPNFTIYDTDDSKKAMLEAMNRCRIDEKTLSVKGVMNLISRAKDKLLTPEEFSLQAENDDFRLRQVARVYAAYQDLLRESNALDFDDLIFQTVRLLQNHEDVREAYQRRFKYVCVDEYQDTNPAQFELTRLLAGGYGNLMVVGDDDQSIYKFRGATIENILSFDRAFSGAKVIKLEQNYRSTQNILDAANAVIAKNESRMGKTLWTAEGQGEKIHVVICEDQNAESRRVVDIISKKVARGAQYRDFAVLYRMNAQSQSLEKAFARSGIPYRILGGTRFADREEIRDAIAYLQLIFNHDDNLRLSRILNKPARKIGAKTAEIVAMIAEEVGCSQFAVIDHAAEYAALGNAKGALESFAAIINQLTAEVETLSLDVFYDRVLDLTGYRQMWVAKGAPEAERLENLDELKSQIIEYMEENEEPSLGGFLEEAALVADVDRYDETADAAVLMTIHSAKGLEFPVVILPGMEEGIFPSQQSIDGGNAELEEERRLSYVALTRAKKELFLLRTYMRLFYGRTCINPESRFLKEIPEKLIAKEGVRGDSFERDSSYRVWDTTTSSPQRQRTYYHDDTYKPFEKKTSNNFSVDKQKDSTTIFAPGDRVKHATFGEGEILSIKPMGADVLYEIAFDRTGTKKLMGSYAKLHKI